MKAWPEECQALMEEPANSPTWGSHQRIGRKIAFGPWNSATKCRKAMLPTIRPARIVALVHGGGTMRFPSVLTFEY
jgi:hypothetical protein